jgi:hypothetical protein
VNLWARSVSYQPSHFEGKEVEERGRRAGSADRQRVGFL